MISFNEALIRIKQQSRCLAGIEQTPLQQTLNRYVAEDIIAPISMPPLPNSAMDGYAIHTDDWQINKSFPVSVICAAGEPPKELKRDTAARIYTGAVIPEGANAVIPQELTTQLDEKITINEPVVANQCIRFSGEDFQQGDTLLVQGERLQHRQILLLANAGIDSIKTYQPIKVALLATGDELLPLGSIWQAGKIFDSNRPCITAILTEWGVEVCLTQTIEDSLESTKKILLEASKKCDVIITTGGVSMGDKDYIRPALEEIGKLTTWKVSMKPGKPIALGEVANVPFIGLPGNPVSALSTLLLLARPLIKKVQGAHQKYLTNKPYKVPANFSYTTTNRQDFLRARLTIPEERAFHHASVNIFDKQQSHIVSSFHWADGLVSIPSNTTIHTNDLVDYYPFHQFL